MSGHPNWKEHSWKPGKSGNPGGRPAGSRNIRTQEVLDLIRAQGHKDPLVTLSELQNSDPNSSIRATAANMLAPYLHSKLAAKPQAPDPIYMEQAVTLRGPYAATRQTPARRANPKTAFWSVPICLVRPPAAPPMLVCPNPAICPPVAPLTHALGPRCQSYLR